MPNRVDYFCDESIRQDIKGKVVRGAALIGIAQVAKFSVQLVAISALAWLLAPADFGLVAMTVVVTGFASMLADSGLSMATVQGKAITHQQASNLFWIGSGLGLFVAICVAAISPIVAWFYNEPAVLWITLAISPTFIITGLSIQHRALLKRVLQFRTLIIVEITAAIIGNAVAIAWAWYFHNYWALVVSPVTMATITLLGSWMACRWCPSLPKRGCGTRALINFGANHTAFNTINYFARNTDNATIGYFWGSTQLGVYSLAYKLLMLPIQHFNSPMTALAIPALSRLVDSPAQYRAFYSRAMLTITSLGMPTVCVIAVVIDHIVWVFLGEKWEPLIPVYLALVPAAYLGTFNVATGWVFLSTGKVDRELRVAIMAVPFMVGFMLLGLPWGAFGVAVGLSSSWIILRLPIIMYCFHGTPISIKDLVHAIQRPFIASIAAAALTVSRSLFFTTSSHFSELVIDVISFSLYYLIFWVIQPKGLLEMQQTLGILKEIRRK